MSISEHANLAEYIERAILGCIFPVKILEQKVKNKSRKRALWYSRGKHSDTSAVELPGFLHFYHKISLGPNGPVCDVYYYASRPRESANETGARANFKFAEFSVSGRPRPGGIYGGQGGGV